jgi:raffinose/stachyose/melibiose transport system permease protein
VVVGNIFSKIFETNRGELNTILRTLNLDFLTQQWLADPKVALYAIAMVNIWQWTGYSMLVYYANMLSIPDDLYEAATIDGAGTVKKFFSITLPLLRSSHFTLFVLGALGTLKCFDLPFVLTKGGPNYATEFFSTYIYKKSFDLFDQGGASTLVVLMFIIAIIITVAQLVIYTRNDKNKEMS